MLTPKQHAYKQLCEEFRSFFLMYDVFCTLSTQWEVKDNYRVPMGSRRSEEKVMSKRGRILRDPRQGPGLLMVEGRQYPFLMDNLWRSKVPATPGLVVEVDFDPHGNLNGITAVSQSQARNYEYEPGSTLSTMQPLVENWVYGAGIFSRVVPATALLLCWLFLNAISIQLPFFGRSDLTFWEVLGYLGPGNLGQVTDITTSPDVGGWGFLGLLALAGPFLPLLWKDRRAHLGGILPLSFIAFVAFRVAAIMRAVVDPRISASYGSPATERLFHVAGIGLGAYLSATLAIVIAGLSAMQFLAASKTCKGRFERSEKVA
jgi:hypothetical protein